MQHIAVLITLGVVLFAKAASPVAVPNSTTVTPPSVTATTELGIAFVVRGRTTPKSTTTSSTTTTPTTTTAARSVGPSAIITSTTEVGIVNQTRQINDDGSYTFGYTSADGSFRIENKDVNGYVTGKYGYIDANGDRQEFEYVAGQAVGLKKNQGAAANSIPTLSSPKREAVETDYAASEDQNVQPSEMSRAAVPTYVPVSSRSEEEVPNRGQQARMALFAARSPPEKMYKIGQSIFRRPTTVVPSVSVVDAGNRETVNAPVVVQDQIEVEARTANIDAVNIQPTPTIGVSSTIDIVQEPTRQVVVEQPRTVAIPVQQQQRQIQVVQPANNDAILGVPSTTATVVEQPVVVSRTEISSIPTTTVVQRQQPARQVVIEQQPIRQIVVEREPAQQIVVEQQPVRQIVVEQEPAPQVVVQRQQPARQIVVEQQQPAQQIIVERQPARQILVEQQPVQQIVVERQQPAQQIVVERQQPAQQIVVERQQAAQQIVVERQQPAQQIVVERQQPAQQIVVERQQPAQQIVVEQRTVPQQNIIRIPTETTYVQQQPTTVRQVVFQPQQQVYEIVSDSSGSFIQQTPVIRTVQSGGRLDQFLREFQFNRNSGNTYQIISSV